MNILISKLILFLKGGFLYCLLISSAVFESSHILFAQSDGVKCGTLPEPVSLTLTPTTCNTLDNYIPDLNTPIKTVRINFHIMQKSDGTGNFQQGNLVHENYLRNSILDWELNNINNGRYAKNQFPTWDVGAPFIADTRIRLELLSINFWQDDASWGEGGTDQCDVDNSMMTFINNNGWIDNGALNIFFNESPGTSVTASGCWNWGYVTIQDTYTDYTTGGQPWNWGATLTHEIGHALGLLHSHSIDSEVDDIPLDNGSWCVPNNFDCSNNVMGYNSCKCYFSPKQMGKIHRSLVTNSTKKKWIDCSYDVSKSEIVNSNTIWEGAKIVCGDLIINSGVSLTAKCDVTMTDGSLADVKNNSTLTLESGKFSLSSTTGSTVTTLRVESGGTLILQPNAQLFIGDGSHILIDPGGKMILNGNNITLNGSTTDIHISGNITTADNVDLTFTGDGFLKFFPTNTLTLGTGSNINITGSGITDGIISLEDGAVVNVSSTHDVQLTDGMVVYKNGGKIFVHNGNVNCTNVDFNSVGAIAGIGIDGQDLKSCNLQGCTFEKLYPGIQLNDNVTQRLQANFYNCMFTQCGKGASADGISSALFSGCNFSDCNTGLYLAEFRDIDVVTFISSNIQRGKQGIWTGVLTGKVNALYIDASTISGCSDYGVWGNRSNVFVRNGSIISGCGASGFFLPASSTIRPSMLTIGDIDCGWVINNNRQFRFSAGIRGQNIILDIDANTHISTQPGRCRKPNRFDGNQMIFDVCYDPSISTVPSSINMRGNFWGYKSGTTIGQPWNALPNRGLLVKNGVTGACDADMTVKESGWRTKQPTTCADPGPDILCRRSDDLPDAALICGVGTKDGHLIDEKYFDARKKFVDGDYIAAKQEFDFIVSQGGELNPPCPQIMILSQRMSEISSAHIRVDSIEQANGSSGGRMGHLNETEENLQQEKFEYKIQNHPNPFSNHTTFSYGVANDSKVSLEIYSITGQLVTKLLNETPVQKGNYQLNWNTEKIPAGVYFYRYVTPVKVLNQKLVIVK